MPHERKLFSLFSIHSDTKSAGKKSSCANFEKNFSIAEAFLCFSSLFSCREREVQMCIHEASSYMILLRGVAEGNFFFHFQREEKKKRFIKADKKFSKQNEKKNLVREGGNFLFFEKALSALSARSTANKYIHIGPM
jgi:hypothetical protein